MDNRCPKCSEKISRFYIKSTCPHCGCDMLYYNLEENLEKDAAQAEKEFEQLEKFLEKFKRFIPEKRRKKDE